MWRFSGTDADAKNALWDSLIATDGHKFQYMISINGVNYGQSSIISAEASYSFFAEDNPSVGSCLAGELYASVYAPSSAIPRMATVNPFVRVTDGTNTSSWLPQGKFFIDSREITQNEDGMDVLTLHCYDAMLRSEADYPNSTRSWPCSDIDVVREIACAMGLQSSVTSSAGIDPRTISLMNRGYTLGLPVGYSMREVLSNIAAMYAGNWIMNYDGQLLLVAVNGIPPETNYLIDTAYDAITFGGDRILV